MPSSPLLTRVEKYVKGLLSSELFQGRPFHNFNHTFQVVQKCNELANHYKLPENDREILLTAAWFHDTGYLHGSLNHEEESAKFSSSFLNDLRIISSFIIRVNDLIMATKLPAKPTTLLQEILCDADLQHLASVDYLEWSDRLHQEIQIQSRRTISETEWVKENISFYKAHHYFTEYAIIFWEGQKQLNLQELVEMSPSGEN